MYKLLLLLIFATLAPSRDAASIPETTNGTSGTIAELVRRQTDTIKKIVSSSNDYPIVSKYSTVTKNPEEELRIKCQWLARLAANRTEHQAHVNQTRPSIGFYVTTDSTVSASTASTSTSTITTTTASTPSPVKYIKLEPIILQKTILSDGRTIYYWHKSLPSAVQFLPPSTGSTTSTSTTTTTTAVPPTTTESGYSFRNFFPSFYAIGGGEQSNEAVTAQTSTTTTSTTERAPSSGEDLKYRQQLKFVVPVPYSPVNGDSAQLGRRPWDFDQYAYYPKPLQPDTVNVEVPYVPTFHVIKAIAVPNEEA